MYTVRREGNVIEIPFSGESSYDELVRACVEARMNLGATGVLLDLAEMSSLPDPGRGPQLAHEIPGLCQGLKIAFVVRSGTALYGIVHQITTLSAGEMQLFMDRAAAREWLNLRSS